MAGRPRVLVLNEYYWPGVEATARLLTELCESLASAYEVTVVTGVVRLHEDEPVRLERNGVRVVRVRSTTFDRSGMAGRAANYVTYLARALGRAVVLPRPDVVVCMTDPPMVGAVGVVLARRFGVPLVLVSQDVFPEIATELGRLRNPVAVAVLRRVVALALRRADRVVAIGAAMRERLLVKGAAAERTEIIRNWVDVDAITPQPRDNRWARKHRLDGRFVVMHSGNVGHAQDLETLVRAAPLVRDLEDVQFVVVGFGARHRAVVELARRLGAGNVRFLPYQPAEALPFSLASADVHAVGLAAGLAGLVVPSRINGILAAARPVIVHADEGSEIAALVREARCGVVVPPGDPVRLAEAIRQAHEGRAALPALGAAGREWVVANASRAGAIARYDRLLREVIGLPHPEQHPGGRTTTTPADTDTLVEEATATVA